MELCGSPRTICPQRITVYISDRLRDVGDDPFACVRFDILPPLKIRFKVPGLICYFAERPADVSMRIQGPKVASFDIIKADISGLASLVDFDMAQWKALAQSNQLSEVLVFPYVGLLGPKMVVIELVFHKRPGAGALDMETHAWCLSQVFHNTDMRFESRTESEVDLYNRTPRRRDEMIAMIGRLAWSRN